MKLFAMTFQNQLALTYQYHKKEPFMNELITIRYVTKGGLLGCVIQ